MTATVDSLTGTHASEAQMPPLAVFEDMLEQERDLANRLQPGEIMGSTGFEYGTFMVAPDVQLVFRHKEDTADLPPLPEGVSRLEATTGLTGVIDAAMKLVEQQDPGQELTTRLAAMKDKAQKGEYDQEMTNVLDGMFAASYVGVDGHGEAALLERPNELGLAEVTLMLAGDEQAAQVVKDKQKIAAGLDAERRIKPDAQGDQTSQTKIPGEKLNEDELELLRQSHLVAVHTTSTKPVEIENGEKVLYPSGHYNVDTDEQVPRASLHWSLNHAVESHIEGNFDDREVTIVVPLVDLAEKNGVPAALNGVDTYFLAGPGESVSIPDSAVMVVSSPDQAEAITATEDQITIKQGNFSPDDIKEFQQFMVGHFKVQFDETVFTKEVGRSPAEVARRTIVEALIDSFEGKTVKSDGMSAFIEDREFNDMIVRLNKELGISGSLHAYTAEGLLEGWFYDAKLGRNERMQGRKGDLENANVALASAVKRAPLQVRRLAMSMGMLDYARFVPPPSNPSDW